MTADLLIPLEGKWVTVAEAARRAGLGPDRPSVRFRLVGSLTAVEWATWHRLRSANYFLVRNRGNPVGERWWCGRCSGQHIEHGKVVIDPEYHEFFTWACIARPWKGLENALWGYAKLTRNWSMQEHLLPHMPSAGKAHPLTLGRLEPTDGSMDLVAVTLANQDALEDIHESKALNLLERINGRVTDPAQKLVL